MMSIAFACNVAQCILECPSIVEYFMYHSAVEKSLECSINSNPVVRCRDLLFNIRITESTIVLKEQ